MLVARVGTLFSSIRVCERLYYHIFFVYVCACVWLQLGSVVSTLFRRRARGGKSREVQGELLRDV